MDSGIERGEEEGFGVMIKFSAIAAAAAAKSLQSRPTLCDPMDCSLLGFSVHGILQARTLEWELGLWRTWHSRQQAGVTGHTPN